MSRYPGAEYSRQPDDKYERLWSFLVNSRRAIAYTLPFLLTVVALGACSSVKAIDAVAVVDGTEITQDDFETLSNLLVEAKIFTEENGSLTSADARSILGTMIDTEAVHSLLTKYDITVTQADRDDFKSQVAASEEFNAYPKGLQDVLTEIYAQQGALARVKAPTVGELEKMYNTNPTSVGMLCLRHLVVKDKTTAKKALAEFKAGTDFAKLAGKYSTEDNTETTGGALSDGDNPCIPLSQYQQQFDIDFVKGALKATVGEAYGPVKSSFGWHLIYVRPFSEVKESLTATFKQSAGMTLAEAYKLTVPVRVDSSFGTWDAESGTIVDL